MTKDLSVGDVVIGQNFSAALHLNGMEGVVIEPLQMRTWRCRTSRAIVTDLSYRIQWASGVKDWVRYFKVKPKKPPREDLQIVRWDQCPWQPETINV